MKKIFFIGGGFISEEIFNKMRKNNYKSYFLSRLKYNLFKKKNKKFNFNNSYIFFSASKAPVKNMKMFEQNIKILFNFFEEIKNQKIKHFIYLSSDAVYSDSKKKINENSLVMPDSLHGLMHLFREKLIENFFKDTNLTILRPTLVFGEKDPHNGYGPNQFIRLAQNNKKIFLFGKGEELRDHVSVETVAKVVDIIIKKNLKGIFNIVSGKALTFYKIVNLIKKNYKHINFSFVKRKGPMPHKGIRVFDNRKLKKYLQTKDFLYLEDFIKMKKKYKEIS